MMSARFGAMAKGLYPRREVPVLEIVRRRFVVGVGVVAVGILGVACSGNPGLHPVSTRVQGVLGHVSIQVPFSSKPITIMAPGQDNQSTMAQNQTSLQGSTHSGEAWPIALPG
jgi:hypothetical protein